MSTATVNPTRMMRKRWHSMIQRCENPESTGYHKYGARGIGVCEHWHDFEAFLSDVGFPPAPGMSLDRIDNDGNYEPGNIRWATASEQRLNQRGRKDSGPAPCGTNAAYAMHLKRGEETCEPCRAAHAVNVRERRLGNLEAILARGREKRACPMCGKLINRGQISRHLRSVHPSEVQS